MAHFCDGRVPGHELGGGPLLEADGGSKVTRASVTMAFDGDLEGEGAVEWLMSYDGGSTARFVGLERVVGKVGGRSGTFVLQHIGAFDGETATADLLVVPGSGTGELKGLSGEGTFEAGMGAGGRRSITLDAAEADVAHATVSTVCGLPRGGPVAQAVAVARRGTSRP